MDGHITIIENMKKLGLSEYEVKAYLSLLENHPINGYGLSKNSGIPRSRIYEILESLKKKQIVFEQLEESNTIYYPLEPKLLISKLKNNFEDILSSVDVYTKKIYEKQETDNKLIVIKGRKNIIDFINNLILQAKTRIAVSIWEEEIEDIKEALDQAIEKGVIVRGIYFGKNNPYKDLVSHRRIERYLMEKVERYMTIIIDSKDAVSGILSRNNESQVTWTKDLGFLEISEDYIAHDLMVNVYSNSLGEKEWEKFEKFVDNVRKEYFGFEEDFNE